jgi:hypothetical protein
VCGCASARAKTLSFGKQTVLMKHYFFHLGILLSFTPLDIFFSQASLFFSSKTQALKIEEKKNREHSTKKNRLRAVSGSDPI